MCVCVQIAIESVYGAPDQNEYYLGNLAIRNIFSFFSYQFSWKNERNKRRVLKGTACRLYYNSNLRPAVAHCCYFPIYFQFLYVG